MQINELIGRIAAQIGLQFVTRCSRFEIHEGSCYA